MDATTNDTTLLPMDTTKDATLLPIHTNIQAKLTSFYDMQQISNLLFYGPTGSGKRTLLKHFLLKIYNKDIEHMKQLIMYVNCSQGKGIKFVREQLKFFAKTQINPNIGHFFKSVVLLNVDKLTIDAQSALRRCIELFNHSTRFFIISDNKNNIMKPILSRFCEMYVPLPEIKGVETNLYQPPFYPRNALLENMKKRRQEWLKKELKHVCADNVIATSSKLYEKAYCGLDIIRLLEDYPKYLSDKLTDSYRYELLFAFYLAKKEIMHEKLLLFFLLHFIFVSSNSPLENMLCM